MKTSTTAARLSLRASETNVQAGVGMVVIIRVVFAMLRRGYVPREYREYAKLVRRIGFDSGDIPAISSTDPRVLRFQRSLEAAADESHAA